MTTQEFVVDLQKRRSSQNEVQHGADRTDRPWQPCKSSTLYSPNPSPDESVSVCEPTSTLPLKIPVEIVLLRGSFSAWPLRHGHSFDAASLKENTFHVSRGWGRITQVAASPYTIATANWLLAFR